LHICNYDGVVSNYLYVLSVLGAVVRALLCLAVLLIVTTAVFTHVFIQQINYDDDDDDISFQKRNVR